MGSQDSGHPVGILHQEYFLRYNSADCSLDHLPSYNTINMPIHVIPDAAVFTVRHHLQTAHRLMPAVTIDDKETPAFKHNGCRPVILNTVTVWGLCLCTIYCVLPSVDRAPRYPCIPHYFYFHILPLYSFYPPILINHLAPYHSSC
jgi:hypothetical protein